jgi:hypothetical protein
LLVAVACGKPAAEGTAPLGASAPPLVGAPPAPATPLSAPSAPSAASASAEAKGPEADASRPGAYAYKGPPEASTSPPDALPDCDEQLAHAGVTFKPATLALRTVKGITCGAPQVVTYLKGPGQIAYDPPPLLTCTMALALASFERIVQEEADRTLHSAVVRIQQLGTYNCRPMAEFKLVSEHSYANAIDVAQFTLKNGTSVTVQHDFDKNDAGPSRPGGVFLHAVAHRSFDEDVFSNVLTPFWDALHYNHLHLDLAHYRVDGFRPHG